MKKEILGIIVVIVAILVLRGAFCFSGDLPGYPLSSSTSNPPGFQGTLSAYGLEEVPAGDDYIAIAGTGIYHLALCGNGSIVSWGDNRYERISSENDFSAIATGKENGVALRSNGSITCWGRIRPENRTTSCTPPGGNDFVAISSADEQNLALRSNGSIVQWGSNRHGEGEVPTGNDFVSIAAGQYCNFALRSDGSVVCWGSEELCDPPPEDEYVTISAGKWTQHLALTSRGELIAWDNVMGWNHYVPSGTDFVAISVGNGRNVALRSDGTMVCWSPSAYSACNTTATSTKAIAIAAASSNVVAITNPRAKEILVVEWERLKARIKSQPGNENERSAAGIRAPVYPVTYVVEAPLPKVQESVMAYCGKEPITGFFINDLIEDASTVPDTYPFREYQIKSPADAIQEFKTHRLTVTNHYLHDHGPIDNADKIVVTNISFGYTPNTLAGNKCLQPVYAFEGYVEKDSAFSYFDKDFVPATENLVAFDLMT